MRTLILVVSIIALNTSHAIACKAPKHAYMRQQVVLSAMLESPEVTKAIIDVAGTNESVTSIRVNEKQGWDISLTSGNTINVVANYSKNNPPGMCPQIESFSTSYTWKIID